MSEEGISSFVATKSNPNIRLRKPTVSDGSGIWSLAHSIGTLDVNSAYSYMLLCRFFSDTCLIAEDAERRVVGFVTAFQPPRTADTLFIWQIGVARELQGQGLAKWMLRTLLSRPGLQETRHIMATITPSNRASQALFHGLARDLAADCVVVEDDGFPAHLFPRASRHETERLLCIGPLHSTQPMETDT